MSTPGQKFPPLRQQEDNWGMMLIHPMAPAAQPLKLSALAGERAKMTYPADSVRVFVTIWKFQP